MRHTRTLAVTSLALALGACGGDGAQPTDAVMGTDGGPLGSDSGVGGSNGDAAETDGGTSGSDGGASGSDGGAGGTGTGDSGIDADGDGYMSDVDCDDANPDVHPGAAETCNGIDDNCDGTIDEGVERTFYKDGDQDGFGVDDAQTNLQGCVAPNDYSATAGDCDDANAGVNPGATETCNGADDDCNGKIDEGVTKTTYYPDNDGDGYGASAGSQETCTKPNGAWVTVSGDCNDADAAMFPGNPEICDGKDNDCDPKTPDPTATDWYKDADGDGFGDPKQKVSACAKPSGYVANSQDCDDKNAKVNPAAVEICDGIDNNCVGGIDEGPVATYPDKDGDGYGDAKVQPTYRCAADATHVTDNTDCDDGNKNIHPGAAEIPGNGIDENCDGSDTALGTQCGPGTNGIASLPYHRGASLTAAANDKPGNPRGAGFYWDDYELATKGGETFTVLMSARSLKGMDPHLYATANSCSFASSVNNAIWWSSHPVDFLHRSRLVVKNAAAGYYDIVATEDAAAHGGRYLLDVVPGALGQTCGTQDLGIWPLGFRQTSKLDATDVEPGSPVPSGLHGEGWEVWLDAKQPYTVLYSATYAPTVVLSAGTACGKQITAASGGLVNGNGARLFYAPPTAGIYGVWASSNSMSASGDYSINVVPGSVGTSCFGGKGDVAGEGDTYAFWPVSGSFGKESLAIGDRVDGWLGQRFFDDYETWLEAGESVTFTMTTSGFTPRLILTSETACTTTLVGWNVASGKTGSVTYTAPTSGIYTLIATSHETNTVGSYTLTGKYN